MDHIGGVVPRGCGPASRSPVPGLSTVPDLVLRQLVQAQQQTQPGVIVLALDGVGQEWAVPALPSARLRSLRSTFPSTSTTAWLTGITGAGQGEHLVVGAEFVLPTSPDSSTGNSEILLDVAHGRWRTWHRHGSLRPGAGEFDNAVGRSTTMFERARREGIPAYTLAQELDALSGPWSSALLRGSRRPARRARAGAGAVSADPEAVAASAVRRAHELLAAAPERPLLLWVYLDFDTYLHRHGPGPRLTRALRTLDAVAARWADAGWTVVAHADHGLVPVTYDEEARLRWEGLDTPSRCRLPSGGAGRVRWLHPRPGTERRLLDEARAVLAPYAAVHTPDELARAGRLPAVPEVLARLGQVVAVGTSPAFPVPDPRVRCEHGGWSEQELCVPLAIWSSNSEGEQP
ncbi:alkaline phosphatase family protein [Streptomyces sp. NPDC053079]|uniref:alkaline phosphatase family protein n=1 Tax=Streptomyces sp. NPDC053079 TaxID=3365697 RepID=UPI0037D78611